MIYKHLKHFKPLKPIELFLNLLNLFSNILNKHFGHKNKKAFPVKETLFHNVIKNYFPKSNIKLKRNVFESGLRLIPEPEGNKYEKFNP